MKCAHCRTPKAIASWELRACADGGKRRKKWLCSPCDIECNRMMLEFFNDPEAGEKIEAYKADQNT
jgi:hypothetical protein